MSKNYEKALSILTNKDNFQIKLGLERISKVLELFDNPQDKLKIIHVAGTNGKGSFCSIISSILKEYGLKVGLFTSPHITKYNERIKINGKEITDSKFCSILEEITEKSNEHNIPLTEFELLTIAAFLYFEREKVEIAVFEVGLGGRLDATNVIKKPFLTAITSLSLDHTDRLGSTIEEIATEKAGILKNGIECVISKTNPGLETVRKIATEKKSPLITTSNSVNILKKNGVNCATIEDEDYEFALNGEYQAENLSLILGAIWILRRKGIFIDEKAFAEGLKNVKHPARFEYFENQNLIIDGAHNPDGARALRASIDKLTQNPVTFIYATINTKDYETILKTLVNPDDELILYDFKRKDAVKLSSIEKYKDCNTISTIDEILSVAKQNQKNQKLTVITGSLYAIGELHQRLTAKIEI